MPVLRPPSEDPAGPWPGGPAELLVRGRIDVTLVSGSSLGFFIDSQHYQGKLFISPFPQSSYTRHILLPKSRPELHATLNDIAEQMDRDPRWHKVLESYRGTP